MGSQGGNQTLRVYLLGRFEVGLAPESVIGSGPKAPAIIDRAWPRRKAKALLKLLALQPDRTLHRERVMDLLWPELAAAAAGANLRKALHHVRSAFADAGFETPVSVGADGLVALDPALWLDTDEFRRMARQAFQGAQDPVLYEGALAQYPGDLLPEDLYEEWTIPAREELRTLRCRLLLNAALLYESGGRFEHAVARLSQLVEADRFDENAYRALMAAYARNGKPALAHRQYQLLKERLERELATAPSQATEELLQQVQNGQVPPLADVHIESFTAAQGSSSAIPPLKYARTTDGVDIAYWSLGEGPALVDMGTLPHSHLRHEWQIERWRLWYQHLARQRQVVRYDTRGIGLSTTRDVPDYSVDTLVLDLEAVVDALALDRVALFAQFHQGPAAIAYAARHPERVSHLIFWCCYSHGDHFGDPVQVQAMHEVLKNNYELYAEMCASTHLGWSDDKRLLEQFGTVIRESARQDVAVAFIEAIIRADALDLLPRVKAPTLVLHKSDTPWLSADAPKFLATIPGAKRGTLAYEGALALAPDQQPALDAIETFLNEDAGRLMDDDAVHNPVLAPAATSLGGLR